MDTFLLFFCVSLVSTATPGPSVIYVTTQGIAGGARRALAASVGVLAADASYLVLSVTGLSAVLAASYELFTMLKWAGAAYLVYIGSRLLLAALGVSPTSSLAASSANGRSSFLGGFMVHAANPKALLYFGALVPQFVDPLRSLWPQLASLALIHMATAGAVLLVYAALSSQFGRSVANSRLRRALSAAAGASMIGAGVSMAFVRRSAG